MMKSPGLLIVEDEYIVACDLEQQLLEMGYFVAGRADNGPRAIELARSRVPDLVLMDIHLRGPMDGISAAIEIRRQQDVPVIFLTAYGEDTTVQRARAAEPHGYILKPFEARELQIIVEMALARHRAERQLRDRERELQAIQDHAPILMLLLDEQRRVLRANHTAMRFAGLETGVLPALFRCGDLFGCAHARGAPDGCETHEECGECPVRKAVMETLATGQTQAGVESKMLLRMQDRTETVWVRISTAPITLEGKSRVLVCMEDVSSHHRLEEQLRQAQKVEAIGQLAGGVAHDFNNVLAATMMHLGLLRLNQNLDEDTRETLKELEEDSARAAGLARQLLLFSRRSVMQPTPLNLNETITHLLRMLRRLLGENIALEWRECPDLPPVEADVGMIEQVVMNLCINARDAMPNGGRLSIALAPVQITAQTTAGHLERRPGSFVCLSVADTGGGMDPATLQRIFEPFFTTKEPGRGTGLGLATVHGIVAQHKGWIEVESQVGGGSTFRVYLPAATEPAPTREEAPVQPIQRGTETVLLVEDEPNVRRVATLCLKALGYTVIDAESGADALRLLNEDPRPFDLVITDLIMPGSMSGVELVRALRQTRPGLKAIVTSGYSAEVVRRAIPADSGITFLPKPYTAPGLAAAVRECLDQK